MPNPVKVRLTLTAPADQIVELVEREIHRTTEDYRPAPLIGFHMTPAETIENAASRVVVNMTFLPQQVH